MLFLFLVFIDYRGSDLGLFFGVLPLGAAGSIGGFSFAFVGAGSGHVPQLAAAEAPSFLHQLGALFICQPPCGANGIDVHCIWVLLSFGRRGFLISSHLVSSGRNVARSSFGSDVIVEILPSLDRFSSGIIPLFHGCW